MMKLKRFIFALVAMLGFSLSGLAQETIVVKSFEELKAAMEKASGSVRVNAARTTSTLNTFSNIARTTGSVTPEDIADGGQLELGADIVVESTIEISGITLVELDLNGFTISGLEGADGTHVNPFKNSASLIIKDSKGGGSIIGGGIDNNGYLEITGGTFKNLDATDATDATITNNFGAECYIKGGNFYSQDYALNNIGKLQISNDVTDVYIEGKNYAVYNSNTTAGEVTVGAGVVIAGKCGPSISGFDEGIIYCNVVVGGNYYQTLNDAVTAAQEGELIRLFADVTESSEVVIDKNVTLDGNGHKLTSSAANAIVVKAEMDVIELTIEGSTGCESGIRITETTGTVNLDKVTVSGVSAYALNVESNAKVTVTNSNLTGRGAVADLSGTNIKLTDTNLTSTDNNVVNVVSNTNITISGGTIEAKKDASDKSFFIIAAADGSENVRLTISPSAINLGGAENYLYLDTDAEKTTVYFGKDYADNLNEKGYEVTYKGTAYLVKNAQARVVEQHKSYSTLALALENAKDGEKVELLWADYKKPVSMSGIVCGKTVTITGTANVDWGLGWFYVGRSGAADGKVIFDGANLTSVSNSKSLGIHVSGRKKGSADTYNGTVEIKNSNIVLDYLIQRNVMSLDNSTLTVKNGFGLTGHPASETEDGKDATATMSLTNNSKLIVDNLNDMPVGYEGIGVLNVDANSTIETIQSFGIADNGTLNLEGTANFAGLKNEGILNVKGGKLNVADNVKMTNAGNVHVSGISKLVANVTGDGWFYMDDATLGEDTKLTAAKVRFAKGTNNVNGSTIQNGWFQVGIGAYNGADANVDTQNGVVVNVNDNAYISSVDVDYAGWLGTGYYDTDAQKTAAMTAAKYVLNINNSTAEFGYLHISNDGELNVNGVPANLTSYNGSQYSFRGGRFIINGTANFDATKALAFYTNVSCDNGTDKPGTINIKNGATYEAEPHNGGNTANSLQINKTGVVNVETGAVLENGDKLNIATTAKLNVAGTVTSGGVLTNSGVVNVNGGKLVVADATTMANAGTVYVKGAPTLSANVTGTGWFYMDAVALDANTKLSGAKVGFINGENAVVGSTIKDGWFSVGIGQNVAAEAAATFAQTNGITMGNVTVNVSENATIYTSTDDAYSGWVGSAYSAAKDVNKYTLNITNSLARFGYMHVSKDGELKATGHSTNKYEYSGYTVDFYAGNFINNGIVTFDGVDTWAQYTKISVDHADAVLDIKNGTKYISNCSTGNVDDNTFLYYKAGTVNVDKTSSVNIEKATSLVEGAKLNIAGNVTAKGAVSGNGTITLTDPAAVYTAPAEIPVVTNLENKMVVYNNDGAGAYKVYDPAAKIGEQFYLTLQDAINAAKNNDVITFVNDVTEDVTVVQAPEVKFTIDGADKTFKGAITVDGKSQAYATAGLTVQNVSFIADDITKEACINLGVSGNSNTRYTSNVTVQNCTFIEEKSSYAKVAVKSYTGGDKNLTITNCKVNGMHSLLQASGIDGIAVEGCTVNTKNGINLNSSKNVEIKNNTVNVNGYAVRIGAGSAGESGDVTMSGNTLSTTGTESDAVIVLRGAAPTQANITMSQNAVVGDTHISGTVKDTKIDADANYWATTTGQTALTQPIVSGYELKVNSYYTGAECQGEPTHNYLGTDFVGYVREDAIWGEAWGNAFNSFVIQVLNAKDELMGTATLKNPDLIDGDVYATWTLKLDVNSYTGSSWNMEWIKAPAIDNMPAKVQLWVDGKNVSGGGVELNSPDNTTTYKAAVLKTDGNTIAAFCPTLENAVALASATDGSQKVAILQAGTYNVPTDNDLTVIGAVDGVQFGPIGEPNMGMKNYTFENVTFNYANDSHYKGLQYAGTMVYNNCTFNGQVFLYGQSETFNNCTFNQTSSETYNVWTYSAKEVAFNNCTFNSAGKSVLIYHEDPVTFNTVSVAKSTFNASQTVEGKAAIEMDASLTAGINLTIDGESKATGFDTDDTPGAGLWNNKKGNADNANNDITVVVAGEIVLSPIYEAQVGEVKHRTLQEAINAVQNGQTVTLLMDVEANVTLAEKVGLYYTLDGASKTLKGTIVVVALSDTNDNRRITIKNINFKDEDDAKSTTFINSSDKNHYPRLTVEGCSFIGSGYDYENDTDKDVAITLKSAYGAVIKDCNGTGLHSFLQNYAGLDLTVENVTVTESKSGLALGTVQGVTVKGCNITASNAGYGIRVDATLNSNAVIEGNTVSAYIPVVVRKVETVNSYFTFNGDNKFTASNTDGKWCVIGSDEYEPGKALPVAPAAKVFTLLNDENLSVEGMHNYTWPIAKTNGVWYASLPEAIAAAKVGATVELMNNVASADVITISKAIILDGKDKTLTYTGSDRAIDVPNNATENIDVTIKNLTVDNTAAYTERGINYNENGTLTLDKVEVYGPNTTYAINLPGKSTDAKINITGSKFTGKIALNLWGANTEVEATDTKFISIDNSTAENYAAIKLNNNSEIAAHNSVINIQGGEITATDEKGAASVAVEDCTSDSKVTISNETIVNGSQTKSVAIIKYGDQHYAYSSLKDAIAVAKDGQTIILIDNITSAEVITINKAITIDGNGKTLTYTGSDRAIDVPNNADKDINVTIKNLTVENTATYTERGINYNENGTLTLDNVTVNGQNTTYAINLPGMSTAAKVNITGSKFTGKIALNLWGANTQVTATGSEFTSVDNTASENYAAIKLNNNGETAAHNSTVTIQGGKVIAKDETGAASVAVEDCTSGSTVDISDETEVVGSQSQSVAIIKYGNQHYSFSTLEAAIAAVKEGAVIDLINDYTMSYGARTQYDTQAQNVVINGNGKILTLNQTNSDWSSFGLKNDSKLILKNMTINKIGYGATNGAWNKHAINIDTKVEMENVTVNNSVAVSADATLTNVTINEANGYYGLWIEAKGQNVTLNGGSIIATNGGRGIKIADEYVDDAQKITLSVTGTKFQTAKKAAVLVSSKAGAHITASNVDIQTVVEDPVNFVWVDEDWAQYYGNVEVSGDATVAVESATDFGASVSANGVLKAYYQTFAMALDAAQEGETITLLADVETSEMFAINKSLTIEGNGHKVTSADTRVFVVTVGKTAVTLNNFDMISTKERVGTTDIRGISVDANLQNVTLTLNNSSVDFTHDSANEYAYAVCISDGASNNKLTVDGGTYEGSKVIYACGTQNSVTVKNATLTSLYPNHDTLCGACISVDQNSSITAEGNTFNGGNALAFSRGNGSTLTESYNTDNTTCCLAKIEDVYYTSLAAAIDAATEGAIIKLLHNIELNAGVIVAADKQIFINLQGKNISYTSDVADEAMITNHGTLTFEGNGQLVYTYTGAADATLATANSAIANDGTLTVAMDDYATIKNATAKMEHATYAIDNYADGTLIINSGKIDGGNHSTIRQTASGSEENEVTICGGEVKGTNYAVWMQAAGSNAKEAPAIRLNIEGGYLNGVYSTGNGNSLNNVSIDIKDGRVDGDINLTNGENKTAAETVTMTGGHVNNLYSAAEDVVAQLTMNITAGKFTTKIKEAYLELGYQLVQENDYFVVRKTNNVESLVIDASQYTDKFEITEEVHADKVTFKRTLNAGVWNSFFVPFEVPLSTLFANYDVAYLNDANFYDRDENGEIEEITVQYVKFTEAKHAKARLKANHPYRIRPKSAEAAQMNLEVTDVDVLTTAKDKRQVLRCGAVYTNIEWHGLYERSTAQDFLDGNNVNDRCYAENKKGIWQNIGTASVASFRIMMVMTHSDDMPYTFSDDALSNVRSITLGEDEYDETGIISVGKTDQDSDTIYDLQGRRVLDPVKGSLYIVNGQKVVY